MRRPIPGQSIQENIMAGPRVQDTIDAGTSDDRRGGDRHCTVHRLARIEREGAAGLWRVRHLSDHGNIRSAPRGESVCQSGYISVVARDLKKKISTTTSNQLQ